MIISEVLDAIDNINSITIESEIDTCRSLLSSYDKMLIIEEYYDGNDINGFKIFQEGEKLDLIKEDLKKQNEGKSTLNKIIFTIPRLIRSIFRLITGKLKKSSEKAKQVSEKYTKVKSKKNFKPAGLIAALALGFTIVWKGKDITKYVKDRIGKKKKKPVENKKQSNPQNNGEQKPKQSKQPEQLEINKETDTQSQQTQGDTVDKKSDVPSDKKQNTSANKQNDAEVENIQKPGENSVIDAAVEDQVSKSLGDDNLGEGFELTVDEVFNTDIEYVPEQFKNVSKIIPIPASVTYDTFSQTLYSSISISAYIDLYNKLFNDLNDYIKNLKDYIVKKSKTPDDNNIKLTEPNIKKTIAAHFEDARKKQNDSLYITAFTKMNDEIDKIEKQTGKINDEINRYLSEINDTHSSENAQNIVPNNYNEIIKVYNQTINECANILNVFIDIMNKWVDATNKIAIKMNDVNFNKVELNTKPKTNGNDQSKSENGVINVNDLKYYQNILDHRQELENGKTEYAKTENFFSAVEKLAKTQDRLDIKKSNAASLFGAKLGTDNISGPTRYDSDYYEYGNKVYKFFNNVCKGQTLSDDKIKELLIDHPGEFQPDEPDPHLKIEKGSNENVIIVYRSPLHFQFKEEGKSKSIEKYLFGDITIKTTEKSVDKSNLSFIKDYKIIKGTIPYKSKSSQDTPTQNKNNNEKKKPTAVVQEADDKIKNLLRDSIKAFIQKNPGSMEQYKDGRDILAAINKLFDGEYSDKKKDNFTYYISLYQQNLLDYNKTNTIVNFHKMLVDKCGFTKRDEINNPINESDFKNGILANELTLKLKFDKIGSKTLMVKGVYKPNN